ncbi:MAG: Holliday junction branch migration protein RuvA [Sphaerochaetaceae bacterium]|jgi:Holliday junction DNA helicase RuvA|nr:Holliday junction branch migration protein RuvA [Sphaerochaetaceae bacterium]
MINALIGELVSISPSSLVVRAGSIEFECAASAQTASAFSLLPQERRSNVKVLTILVHHEDVMSLIGFYSEEERHLFQELVKVPGVGNKQALKILSGVKVNDFIRALDNNDIDYLSRIPGLGTKTSQKIILALRDTLVQDYEISGTLRSQGGSGEAIKPYSDLVEALSSMGYDKKRVVDSLLRLVSENSESLAAMGHQKAEEWLFVAAISDLS